MHPRIAPLLALAVMATPVAAQEVRLTPDERLALPDTGASAGSSGVHGIATRILYGDPTKPGLYTIEIAVPPNTSIAAHSHRDYRTAVVAAGTWYFGYGARADKSLVEPLPAGSFYTEPAGVPHFAMTGSEAARVIITGAGPTDTQYVVKSETPTP